MVKVNIPITDDDLALARQKAARQGFPDVESYIHDLVTRRLHNEDAEPNNAIGVDAASKSRLKELILEGLESPSRERTKADFDRVRQELIDRHQQSRAG